MSSSICWPNYASQPASVGSGGGRDLAGAVLNSAVWVHKERTLRSGRLLPRYESKKRRLKSQCMVSQEKQGEGLVGNSDDPAPQMCTPNPVICIHS